MKTSHWLALGIAVTLIAFGGGAVGKLLGNALIYGGGFGIALFFYKQDNHMPTLYLVILTLAFPFLLSITGISDSIIGFSQALTSTIQRWFWFGVLASILVVGYNLFNPKGVN